MAEPVDDMDVDEIGSLSMSPMKGRLFYERVKRTTSSFPRRRSGPRMTRFGSLIQQRRVLQEPARRRKGDAHSRRRTMLRHDCTMWRNKIDEKAAQHMELEAKFQDESQKFQEMTDLYNEAVRMKHRRSQARSTVLTGTRTMPSPISTT